jgi:HlyD family secretion protein
MNRLQEEIVGKGLTRRLRSPILWVVASLVFSGAIAAGVWMIASPKPTPIMAEAPSSQDLESSVSTSGRVVPEHEFIARANFPGLIDAMDVQLGQNVMRGQVLVRMRDPYAETRVASATAALQTSQAGSENMQQGGSQEERMVLQNDLARAQAEKAAAEASLSMLEKLQQDGAASGAEVHGAMQRLEAAEQTLRFVDGRITHRYSGRDVASWAAHVNEARSSLASAKASLANTNITSPIAGTVYLVPITSNDFVSTGTELLRVADLHRLEVHANFDEADMGKLHPGSAVQIRWEGRPERVWHGLVKHAPFAAVISGVRSVGECIITITDVKDDLPPNTTVNVSVIMDSRKHVLTLPREALHTEGSATFVYRVADGTLVRTSVRVGLINLDHFEVLSGIGPTDHAALHAMDNRELFNGMSVRARP